MENQRRNFWGWGYADYELDSGSVKQFKSLLQMALGIEEFSDLAVPKIDDINLRPPRIVLPDELMEYCTSEKFERASHSYGKSYRDVWRGIHGQYDNPPDYVAYPTTEEQILSLMQFATNNGISLIPFGGGSSVVGGVEPTRDERYSAVISVDMKHFDQILEVNVESRSARIQAGIFGPALDRGLKEYGLTMRHYPQSFEFSTLGGWIATRSGGHYATLFTHIDEFVQSIRMVTPEGVMQSRRLPGSGAGPSEERLMTGSEGIFGISTEAWVRLQHIPTYKSAQTINFREWGDAVQACRALAQSGLNPTNARLIDQVEALSNGLGEGQHHVIILGFESHNHDVQPLMEAGLNICSRHNGSFQVKEKSAKRSQAADKWKKSFLQAPYLRDEFVRLGCIMETFETAVTWDQFDASHQGILTAANEAIQRICGGGMITCRFTHLYPDGPAPYYTIMAKGQTGREIEQWNEIKQIVSDKIIELGGTITHHHAVGKDHQPYYKRQRSEIFAKSITAIKERLDPSWIMNPDVLIDRV